MSGVFSIAVFTEKEKMETDRIRTRRLKVCSNPLELP